MTTDTEPKLAAPGAGLPAPELFIAKKLFALKCLSGSRENFIEGFKEETAKIRALLNTCPKEQCNEQVLISRHRGLEDSSRHWSVWMTLDHLRIVNNGIFLIISELSYGRTPEGKVSTAEVKPNPDLTESIVEEFENGCADFLEQLACIDELKSKALHSHPWFGPMDAFRWLALASMHMGIHRKQIAAIISGLKP